MLINVLKVLVYELLLEKFNEKMIKQLIFLTAFYISHDNDTKTFLIWFINNCSKNIN